MDCIIDLLRAPSEDVFMERRSLLEEAPKPFFEIVWIHAALCVHTNTLAFLSVERQRIGGERRYPVFWYSTPPNA